MRGPGLFSSRSPFFRPVTDSTPSAPPRSPVQRPNRRDVVYVQLRVLQEDSLVFVDDYESAIRLNPEALLWEVDVHPQLLHRVVKLTKRFALLSQSREHDVPREREGASLRRPVVE